MQIRRIEVLGVGQVMVRVQEDKEFSQLWTIPPGCVGKGTTKKQAEVVLQALAETFSDRDIYVPVAIGQGDVRSLVRRQDGSIVEISVGGLLGTYATAYLVDKV